MLTIKGFISHALLTQNVPGQVSPIGELTTLAQTFAREKGYYVSAAADDYTLTTFRCDTDGVKGQLNPTTSDHVLAIAKYVLDKTLGSTDPIAADELLLDLAGTFVAVAEEFDSGEIVTDGRFYAPQWLSWKSTVAGIGENFIRIWFADEAFRLQYDEFEILVTPPFTPLNDFFLQAAAVQAKLPDISEYFNEFMEVLNQARGNQPETVRRTPSYTYIDPLNAANTTLTFWGVLVYGAAGDNSDAIDDAVAAYVLANSTHTRDEWLVILPDLFKRTEFLFTPRWDVYAIPNRTVEAGIYSPLVDFADTSAFVKSYIPGWPAAHIDNYLGAFTHPYKCLGVPVVGGPENRENLYRLRDVFEDFLSIASTSLDFNRMSNDTKTFVEMLDALVRAAEEVSEFSNLPYGISRVKRAGKLFVGKKFQNISYLVLCRASVPQPA
jgi:hypothetical protein